MSSASNKARFTQSVRRFYNAFSFDGVNASQRMSDINSRQSLRRFAVLMLCVAMFGQSQIQDHTVCFVCLFLFECI